MKLIYNSIIDIIEENISISNIGARKNKSPRDHLYVLYSVIDEVLRGKEGCGVDLVFYDLAQAYDSLWVEHTLLDLFHSNIDSNLLNTMYKLTQENKR